jgi:hypothetical protein
MDLLQQKSDALYQKITSCFNRAVGSEAVESHKKTLSSLENLRKELTSKMDSVEPLSDKEMSRFNYLCEHMGNYAHEGLYEGEELEIVEGGHFKKIHTEPVLKHKPLNHAKIRSRLMQFMGTAKLGKWTAESFVGLNITFTKIPDSLYTRHLAKDSPDYFIDAIQWNSEGYHRTQFSLTPQEVRNFLHFTSKLEETNIRLPEPWSFVSSNPVDSSGKEHKQRQVSSVSSLPSAASAASLPSSSSSSSGASHLPSSSLAPSVPASAAKPAEKAVEAVKSEEVE